MKIQAFNDYSLLSHNTFGLDVKTESFVEYSSVEEFRAFLLANELKQPYLHIGQGSNLLFVGDYKGTILHSAIKGIEIIGENDSEVSLRVGAGIAWDDFVAYCVDKDWYGAENLSLIPGEVGASAVQNIGAYGVEASNLITAVETIDTKGKCRLFSYGECGYAYRESIFKHPEMKSYFVMYVHYKLSKKKHFHLDYGDIRRHLESVSEVDLKTVRDVIINIRRNKLPDTNILGNAGSFFVNPVVPYEQFEEIYKLHPSMPFYKMDNDEVKIPAGWLIEQCGWKGKSLGKAAVYDKQALVLVNQGGASASDIVGLSDAIRSSVYQKFGIKIRPEVNFIG